MTKPCISVVVTTYNQPVEAILATLRSILLQQDVTFDLVIADDHSARDHFDTYRRLFDHYKFEDYTLIRQPENVKTVRNLLIALESANYPLVKAIDAGDLLYSPLTLHQIANFCLKNNVCAGFGNIIRFSKTENGFVESPFKFPRFSSMYSPNNEQNRKQALETQLLHADWIPAGAQFYRTSFYHELLELLYSTYNVRFCQDFAGTLALEKSPVLHFDQSIYRYEWGTGISTNGGIESRKRLYRDHEAFYSTIYAQAPLGVNASKALGRFKFRKFVALKTPLYSPLQKIVNRRTMENRTLKDSFFDACIASD